MRNSRTDPRVKRPRACPGERGVGQQGRWSGFGPEGHGWRVRRGTECDFRASMPCNVERASSAGLAGFGPDGTAGGCGGARNAISAQGPYGADGGPGGLGRSGCGPVSTAGGGGAWNAIFAQGPCGTDGGPGGLGCSGYGPVGTAGGGGARNAISVQRPYGAGDGPAGRRRPPGRFSSMRRDPDVGRGRLPRNSLPPHHDPGRDGEGGVVGRHPPRVAARPDLACGRGVLDRPCPPGGRASGVARVLAVGRAAGNLDVDAKARAR
jgi:hypothetical protein